MNNPNKLTIKIKGMSCVACATRLQKALNQIPKISAQVNFATETAIINSSSSINNQQILTSINQAGFQGEFPKDSNNSNIQVAKNKASVNFINLSPEFKQFLGAAIFSAPFILLMSVMILRFIQSFELFSFISIPKWHLPPLIQFLLASIVQFIFGKNFYISGWRAFRSGSANMDTLVALGTTSAYLLSTFVWIFNIDFVGLYFEASAGIITFVLLGKYLESRAKKSSQSALDALHKLKPATARKLSNKTEDFDSTIEVEANQLKVGDRIIVKSGESIPADGKVIKGNANIDQSMLTGESLPKKIDIGDNVYAATINSDGLLIIEVSQTSNHSLLANIINMVSQAQGSKAKIQKLVDRIAEVFVPTVIVISFITFIGWLVAGFLGIYSFTNLNPTNTNIILMSIINATTVLVIACPCAVGLATPVAIVVAIGKAAQIGILVRDFGVFERLIKINRIGFDKTGTLTIGKPRLTKIKTFLGIDENKALQIAGTLELGSNHPLAIAVLNENNLRNIALATPEQIKNHPGLGIEGSINNINYFCGSANFLISKGINIQKDDIPNTNDALLFLANQDSLLSIFAFRDELRDNSTKAIKEWLAREMKISIISGDRQEVVQSFLSQELQANILQHGEITANLLPKGKLNKIKTWQNNNEIVMMIGDGINDAPALAMADVGIAIGAGSEAAIQSADISLLKNDILQSIRIYDLAHASFATIKRNLFFAFIFNSLGIPLAALGYINPLVAGIMMALSSLTVVCSSLLLKLWQAKV